MIFKSQCVKSPLLLKKNLTDYMLAIAHALVCVKSMNGLIE